MKTIYESVKYNSHMNLIYKVLEFLVDCTS